MPPIAYIKTDCEHCEGSIEFPSELAGQSIECPHCQKATALPSPFVPPPVVEPVPVPEPTRQANEVFFDAGGVFVSRTLFSAQSQSFALANISSVALVQTPPQRVGPMALGLLGAVLMAVNIWFGLFVVIVSVVIMCLQKSQFSVVLTGSGGEMKAYSSYDHEFVRRVDQAVMKAIVSRG